LFVGLGNGTLAESAEKPAGGVLCVEAATGRRVWRCDVPDSVFSDPVLCGDDLFFGARNGLAYAINRADGRVKWKTDLKSAIIASPTLVEVGEEVLLYVANSDGKVVRLNPEDGKVLGAFDIAARTHQDVVLYSTPLAVEVGGRVRLFLGCSLDEMSRGTLYCVEDRTPGP
jgi:outer membrane protein assembly factor BamB